jgi:hypothetical protein
MIKMSWEIVLKNDDEYARLYTKAMELSRQREEIVDELNAIRGSTTDSNIKRIDAQKEIIAMDEEILDVWMEVYEKYKHQDAHEGLGDER